MLPLFLHRAFSPFMELVFFGGKGGVGKSTTAAATATYIASLAPQKRVLLISFDMAHNLSDLFDREIGDKTTQVMDNLWAIEPDADRYTEEFVSEFVSKSKELLMSMPIVRRLTDLEKYIDESFSAAAIPLAVKNSIFFEEIISNSTEYDVFVVDMPPTGNMISIFEVPKTSMQVLLKSTLETMDKVSEFMQTIRRFNPATWFRPQQEQKHRRNVAKDLVRMLRELDARGDTIMKLLREQSSLRFVSIPERPSFEEIRRASQLVGKYVRLDGVVINKIVPQGIPCPHCNGEHEHQQRYIRLIEETFAGKAIWKATRMDDEVIGIDRLMAFSRMLYPGGTLDEVRMPG